MSSTTDRKTPTLLIIAEHKTDNLAALDELLHGVSTTLKLPIILITNFDLTPGHRHKYPLIVTEKVLSDKMLKKADIGLMLNGNISKDTIEKLTEKNIVPILPASLESHLYGNYNPVQETGNCFIFQNPQDPWSIFAAIVRAVETYQFPYDWSNLIRGLKANTR